MALKYRVSRKVTAQVTVMRSAYSYTVIDGFAGVSTWQKPRVPPQVFYVRDFPTCSVVQRPCTGAQGLFAHSLTLISNRRVTPIPVQSTINVLNIDLETIINKSLCYIPPHNRHVSLFLITRVRVRLCLHLNGKCVESAAVFFLSRLVFRHFNTEPLFSVVRSLSYGRFFITGWCV